MLPAHVARPDNVPRWDGQRAGHFEVWYFKCNLPEQRLAFWLRYTLLAPRPGGGPPVAEVWGVAFDAADPARNQAWKQSWPARPGLLGSRDLGYLLQIGEFPHHGTHTPGGELRLQSCSGALGTTPDPNAGLTWELLCEPVGPPLRHYPGDWLYRLPIPRTKAVGPRLAMQVSGTIRWNGQELRLDRVQGHQGHFWGTQHAEQWAWANCTDFPAAPGAVLELLSARIGLGPFVSPDLTLAFLRHGGRAYRFNDLGGWARHRSQYDPTGWTLSAIQDDFRLEVRIDNQLERMVGLTYRDPDGSVRICHNSKQADVQVQLEQRSAGGWQRVARLQSPERTAFEVVQRTADPRVRLLI